MTDKPALPRVIAVTSGKGGVGKSSICVNLGISLAKTGARVCLLDADTGLANANILLGLNSEFSLEHVLYGAKAIEDVMLDGPYGMKIIPGANGISECVSLHASQQLRLTRELARIEGEYDFLLIDTAAGVAPTTLDFISASHCALIVITPEPTSLTDAFSMIKLLRRRHSTAQYQVVVNMSGSAGEAKEVFHRFASAVEKYIGVHSHYLGFVLRDESMRAAVVLQNPVTMFPDSDPSCRSFKILAEKLETATAEIPVEPTFCSYWQRQYALVQDPSADKGEAELESRPAPADAVQQTTGSDSAGIGDNVATLGAKMCLLVEQGQAPASELESMLQGLVDAYIKRFQQLPVDILKLVDTIVALPNRDDQLARDIAERVRPWACYNNSWLDSAMSLRDLAVDKPAAEPATDAVNVPSVSFSILNEQGDIVGITAERSQDDSEAHIAAVAGAAGHAVEATPGTYDGEKFGSQERLLALLKQNDNSEASLLDLLNSL
jgi:MinD-like ATPase involved in chromosome partitioning or flagellar assembly